ncbi:MAG: hypothetical protein AAGC60_09765 [Acidobacteriota bacterium]
MFNCTPSCSRRSPLRAVLRLTLALTLALALPLSAAGAEKEWSNTYSLAADGRIALSNVNGDVTITGWDGDEVLVEATIRGSESSLDKVEIDVDARPESLEIETRYPRNDRGWGSNNAEVEYRLQVPRRANLDEISLVNGSLDVRDVAGDVEASLVNGSIEAGGLAGDAELATVNGGIVLEVVRLGGDQRLEIDSVNGSIELVLPASADAEVRAETVHGAIRNEFGLEVDRDGIVGQELRGTVGAGGGLVSLENVNGSIEIRRN